MENKDQIGLFVIARHHESEWNKLGLWTGKTEVHLSSFGEEGARKMGYLVKDLKIDNFFVSTQTRAIETLNNIIEVTGKSDIPISSSSAINERDYGDYTGKNKWDLQKLFGEDKFNSIRRDWDCPIPNGETLKMVYARAVPFYQNNILPLLLEGKNILMVAHGNSIRALTKYIENISDKDIAKVEVPFGAFVVYKVNKDGFFTEKKILEIKENNK